MILWDPDLRDQGAVCRWEFLSTMGFPQSTQLGMAPQKCKEWL